MPVQSDTIDLLHGIKGRRIDEEFMKKLCTMPLEELQKVAEVVNGTVNS